MLAPTSEKRSEYSGTSLLIEILIYVMLQIRKYKFHSVYRFLLVLFIRENWLSAES